KFKIKIFFLEDGKVFSTPLNSYDKFTDTEKYVVGKDRTAVSDIPFLTDEPVVKNMLKAAEKVALTDSAVLITGETGTGKEVLARLIQKKSRRKNDPFVMVNCAAVPHNLMEAEFFGYKQGAFTGANSDSPGKFRMADKGTIFLDEIGDIPLDTQPKLLRVLDYNSIQPLGESNQIQINTRLIAATNADIEKAVATGAFRSDLYYRINVFRLHLPPLRNRPRDIVYLFKYFLKQYSEKNGISLSIKDNFKIIKLLQNYSWPGNIRQLRNLCENLFIGNTKEEIGIANVEEFLNQSYIKVDNKKPQYKKQLEISEKKMIENALKSFNFNVAKTAGYLGLSRVHLYRKIKKHDIAIERGKNKED
ncbi:MAG: sigma-54-dependent Fis family transcriptional regulator, partial [Calditrichia bacterium]|nr:sigma-54-dependent Fis family transcriptional regulator [Calditrichia bacterium]